LDGTDLERGELLPAEGAADQQRQDDGVPLALEGGAVGDGQQFLGLLFGEPVPQPGSLLPDVGVSVRLAASSADSIPFLRASETILRMAESRTLMVEADKLSSEARYSIRSSRVRGRTAEKAKRSSRALA